MIEIKNLSVRFGAREVLKEISINIPKGRWTALVGPNGAGKSTLLKVLLGALTYSGNALENGEEIFQRNRNVAYIPQNPQIPIGMRVHEYVSLGRKRADRWLRETKESNEFINQAMQDCGLSALRNSLLTQISGGELQRAHVARVLVQSADLILLDEPTSALDMHHQISVLSIIEKLKNSGVTIVSTMHDLTLAAMYADEIAILSDGCLLNHGDAKEIVHGQDLKDAFNNRISVYTLDSGSPVILPQKDF